MGKLKTHSPTYCMTDNWENMLNLTHTLNKIYLTGIEVQFLQISLHNYDNEMVHLQTNEYDLQGKMYLTICTHHKLHNNNENKFPVFPERICSKWQNMM